MKYFGTLTVGMLAAGTVLLTLSFPFVASAAWSGLIPCGNLVSSASRTVTDPCTFDDLILLAQAVIKFLIFKIAAPLAAIMFAYAGFLWVTNGGNESQISKAKDIFWMVFWGLVVALAAWLTINMIINFFLYSDYSLLSAP